MESNNLPTPGYSGTPEYAPARFSLGEPDYLPEEGGADGDPLRRVRAAVLYYKWVILLITVAGSALGVFASRFVPLEYTAEATIWIEGSDQASLDQGPIQSAELLQGNAWIELLRSYTVLDHVAYEQRLYLESARRDRDIMAGFQLDSSSARGAFVLKVNPAGTAVELITGGQLIERAAPGDSIGRRIGFLWSPARSSLTPDREVRFTVVTPRDAARTLNDVLQTRKAERGNFVRLQYVGSDRETVAAVLNAVANRYIEVAAELKRIKLMDLRDILKSQLDYAGANLDNAELALENFRVATITLPSGTATPVTPGLESTQTPVLSSFFDLKIERDELERDRQVLQRVLDLGTDALSIDALSFVASVQQSPELSQALTELASKRASLRALHQVYTVEHPLVRRAQEDVAQMQSVTIPQLTRGLLNELSTRITALDNLVDSASTELREIPTRVLDEARLTRSVAIAENLYNDLRQRYENARLATETTVPDVRILDFARVPQQPSSDQRMRIMLLAVLGSIGVGLAVAVLLERADPRIRYPEQVSSGLRLPIIGAVPELKMRAGLVAAPARAGLLEALRGIRLNISNAHGTAGPVIVTISSPGSGDGKTFITTNLGLAYADMGLRVLVIDGDTRRGTVHRMFELDRKPGLTDYLAGDLDVNATVRRTSFAGLDVMTSGTRVGNAPELLSSPRMGQLLSWIRSQYQVVLIDSPPLGAGIDPLVLATLSGNILLIMRTGKTDRDMAAAKLAMLGHLPIRVLGAVINGFDGSGGYRYYSYLPGYEAGEEEPEENLLQPS